MKVFGFERLLRERVTGIGVEAGGDSKQIGLELFDGDECSRQNLAIFGARRCGRHREIETIVADIRAAGAGIAWELMDRKKGGAGLTKENVFGAVAVVNVEVEDGDFFCTGSQRFKDSDGDGIQVAEAHAGIAR